MIDKTDQSLAFLVPGIHFRRIVVFTIIIEKRLF